MKGRGKMSDRETRTIIETYNRASKTHRFSLSFEGKDERHACLCAMQFGMAALTALQSATTLTIEKWPHEWRCKVGGVSGRGEFPEPAVKDAFNAWQIQQIERGAIHEL